MELMIDLDVTKNHVKIAFMFNDSIFISYHLQVSILLRLLYLGCMNISLQNIANEL